MAKAAKKKQKAVAKKATKTQTKKPASAPKKKPTPAKKVVVKSPTKTKTKLNLAPKKTEKPAKKELKGAKLSEKAEAPKKPVALGPMTPGRLGEKRHCPSCSTKFYDFERLPITCPKCFSEFEPEDFETKIVLKSDPKKRPVEKEEEPERELVVSDSGEDFESLEDLSDDDSAVVGIGPDKDTDESFD